MNGILYIVATPIGNLDDMTFRAVQILKAVDLILAESAEHSRRLCGHYGIQTPITSYNQHNHKAKVPRILKQLQGGSQMALMTNAGTPGISDPGALLVNQAVQTGIRVIALPGASAVPLALSAAGLRCDRFYFGGFLSSRSGKRKKELQTLASMPWTLVFFEAPHRLPETLADLVEVFGERPAVLWREMTKLHEEALRGSLHSIFEQIQGREIKGEVTLVIAGAEKKMPAQSLFDHELIEKIKKMLENKVWGVKEIANRLAQEQGLPYRQLYKAALALTRRNQDQGN